MTKKIDFSMKYLYVLLWTAVVHDIYDKKSRLFNKVLKCGSVVLLTALVNDISYGKRP